MLLAHNKIQGSVIFNRDNLKILKINHTICGSLTSAVNVGDIKSYFNELPAYHAGNNYDLNHYYTPRYGEFIFVLDTDNHGPGILKKDIDAIDEESLNNSGNHDIQIVVNTLKIRAKNSGVSDSDSESVNIGDLFEVAFKRDDKLVIENNEFTYNIDKDSFQMDYIKRSASNSIKEYAINFTNEFETITLITGSSGFISDHLADKINKRLSIKGRVSSIYKVSQVFSSNSLRDQIFTKPFPFMKIDKMLNFFGTTKKSQTKVDTLSGCLRGWAAKYYFKRHDDILKIGNKIFIEINSQSNGQSNKDILPLDYILSRSSYMKILASEVVDKRVTRLIVELVENEVEDMSQILYSILEQNGNGITITGIEEEKFKKIIDKIKTSDLNMVINNS